VDVKDEDIVAALFAELGEFDHLAFTAGDWGQGLMEGPLDRTGQSGHR
jgi:hypothetical protein